MPTDDLDEEFEEVEPEIDEEEIDEEALEEEDLGEEFGEGDDDAIVEAPLDQEADEEEGDEEPVVAAKRKKATEDEEDDDELDPDDVEADLDTILKDRIAAADDLDEDEEEEEEVGESTGRVQPKTDSEFVCKSCFLVKSVSQRVDGTDDLCSDCV
jgi:hypothetical protein